MRTIRLKLRNLIHVEFAASDSILIIIELAVSRIFAVTTAASMVPCASVGFQARPSGDGANASAVWCGSLCLILDE